MVTLAISTKRQRSGNYDIAAPSDNACGAVVANSSSNTTAPRTTTSSTNKNNHNSRTRSTIDNKKTKKKQIMFFSYVMLVGILTRTFLSLTSATETIYYKNHVRGQAQAQPQVAASGSATNISIGNPAAANPPKRAEDQSTIPPATRTGIEKPRTSITAHKNNNNNVGRDDDYCKWTVITGDSNNRNAYRKWLELEQRKERAAKKAPSSTKGGRGAITTTTVLVARRSPIRNKDKCDLRWSDNEFVILTTTTTAAAVTTAAASSNATSNNPTVAAAVDQNQDQNQHQQQCHIVSLKFMSDQHESLERIYKNWTNTDFCGSFLEDTLLELQKHQQQERNRNRLFQQMQRPTHPDTIWFSHGLWKLPNNGTIVPSQTDHDGNSGYDGGGSGSSLSLTCEERFKHNINAFRYWKQDFIIQTIIPRRRRRLVRSYGKLCFPSVVIRRLPMRISVGTMNAKKRLRQNITWLYLICTQ